MNHEGTGLTSKHRRFLIRPPDGPPKPKPYRAQMRVFPAQYKIFPEYVLLYQCGMPVAVIRSLKLPAFFIQQ